MGSKIRTRRKTDQIYKGEGHGSLVVWLAGAQEQREAKAAQKLQNRKANSTAYSHLVTHDSTSAAQRGLTAAIRREPVYSAWYDRWRMAMGNLLILTSKSRVPHQCFFVGSCTPIFHYEGSRSSPASGSSSMDLGGLVCGVNAAINHHARCSCRVVLQFRCPPLRTRRYHVCSDHAARHLQT